MSGLRRRVTREERAIVRMLRDRTSRGQSLFEISRTSRVPKKILVSLAHEEGIRYRNQRPTPEQIGTVIQAVVDRGLTFRAAAWLANMSKTAAHRYVVRRRESLIRSKGDIDFRAPRMYARNQERSVYRCPVHGLVNVSPCVACAAIAAKSADRGAHPHSRGTD